MGRKIVMVAVACFALTGCWSGFRNDAGHSGNQTFEAVLSPANIGNLGRVWAGTTGGSVSSSPAIVGGVAYAGSNDGKLYAFDAAGANNCSGTPSTCTPLWTGATGGPISSSPSVAYGSAFVGSTDGKLYAFDKAGVVGCAGSPTTCTPRWSATTGGPVTSSPVVADTTVYVGSGDGKLYAFDMNGAPRWNVTTGGPITSSPAVANGSVYVGSNDGKLYAFDTAGAFRWSAATGGSVVSSPSVVDGSVYIGSNDGKLYAFDTTGAPLWNGPTGGPVTSSPAVANGVVYVGSNDGKLYAFDTTGAPLWNAPTGGPVTSSPAVANGVVYVGSNDGKLYAFDTTGAPLSNGSTAGSVTSSPAVLNGLVYVGSNDGSLYAFGLAAPATATSTALVSSVNPSTFGSAVTFTATVTSANGTPSGTVTFTDGTTNLGTQTLTIGQASVTLSSLTVGTHTLIAGYSGTSGFGASTASALTQTVTLAPTSTALVSSVNPSTFGSAVTFTATVTSANGTPSGTVTFTDGATNLGTQTLTNGQATITLSSLTVGTHTVTTTYGGGATFATSTSSSVVQVVNGSSATLFVNRAASTCLDSGTGSSAAPFCTINAAAQKATAGTTVVVASGTYPEQVNVAASGTQTAPIAITAADGASVTVSGGTNGFTINAKNWITVHGFTVTGTTSHGILVVNSSNVTVDTNRVTLAGQPTTGLTAFGIQFSGVTQSRIANNTTDHNSDAGVHVVAASNTNVITGNNSSSNARGYVRAAAGIDVRESTGNMVFANVSHDNEDSGFNAWTGTTNGQNTFFDNVAYRNGDHGIDVHNAVDAHVVANTVFANSDSGIESTTSTRTYLANNISVDNGINSPRTAGNIRIDSASVSTAILDDDLVFLRVPGTMVDWAGTRYTSLAAFRTATGKETRGIEADPRFRASVTADFHLVAGSPAIDSANADASGQPPTDFDGLTRVDDPATTNTGIGQNTYTDRGAFEFPG